MEKHSDIVSRRSHPVRFVSWRSLSDLQPKRGGWIKRSGREKSLADGGGHDVGDVSDIVFLLRGDIEV
jgi:hypothetical protein